jgi:hypothetical protein
LPDLLLAFRRVIPSLAVKVTTAGGKKRKNGKETALDRLDKPAAADYKQLKMRTA